MADLDSLLDRLRSGSLHARYGAVMSLRKMGPAILPEVFAVLASEHEGDYARLAALEALRPFHMEVAREDLRSLWPILNAAHAPSLKIEVIQLLERRGCVEMIPALRECLEDDVDERIQDWGLEDESTAQSRVCAYAEKAIQALERLGK
jgi:hypothetical protein